MNREVIYRIYRHEGNARPRGPVMNPIEERKTLMTNVPRYTLTYHDSKRRWTLEDNRTGQACEESDVTPSRTACPEAREARDGAA